MTDVTCTDKLKLGINGFSDKMGSARRAPPAARVRPGRAATRRRGVVGSRRRGWNVDHHGAAPVPAVRSGADRDVRGPGDVAAVRDLPERGPAGPAGDVLPAARPGLLVLPAGAAAGVRARGADLLRLRLLLLVLRLVGGARPAVRRVDDRAA